MPFVVCCALVYFWTLRFSRIGDFYTLRLGFFGNLDLRIIHSFAVNILNNGANIKTVSSLLGHSSLQMTEKYMHAIDKLKQDAINSLPELDI